MKEILGVLGTGFVSVLIMLIALAVTLSVATGITMLGWYLFAVSFLGWKMLTFWQAFGLMLLFGGAKGAVSLTAKK
jgi:hypothetical protein